MEQASDKDPSQASYPDMKGMMDSAQSGQQPEEADSVAPRPEAAGRVMDRDAAHYVADARHNLQEAAAGETAKADAARAGAQEAGDVGAQSYELGVARAADQQAAKLEDWATKTEPSAMRDVDVHGDKAPQPRGSETGDEDRTA